MSKGEDPAKVRVRCQFLDAIDTRIQELMSHSISTTGEPSPDYDLMINQRNRIAVFIGESKHRYDLKRRK